VALMVVDDPALLAVLLRTLDAARFDAALANAPVRLISAATRAEVACVTESRKGAPGRTVPEWLPCEGDFETAAVTPQPADLTAAAFGRFGAGRRSAALTLGDSFVYARAQTVGLPLLFRDGRFQQTDFTVALPGE
jgi:ribonuclease VapC